MFTARSSRRCGMTDDSQKRPPLNLYHRSRLPCCAPRLSCHPSPFGWLSLSRGPQEQSSFQPLHPLLLSALHCFLLYVGLGFPTEDSSLQSLTLADSCWLWLSLRHCLLADVQEQSVKFGENLGSRCKSGHATLDTGIKQENCMWPYGVRSIKFRPLKIRCQIVQHPGRCAVQEL